MLYRPDSIKDMDYDRDLGDPGTYPYTRGVYTTMYTGRLWTMRQYAGYATAEESNKRYRYLLQQGQTGLSVAFDLPTQMGYDSDHGFSRGEVGKTGVAIDSLEDMEILFRSIPLDRVSTSMTINATAAILLAMYIVVAEKQGVSCEKLSGTIQNDILKEYVARGTYIYPPEPSIKLTVDIMAYCSEHLPKWNTISVSGYHIREAGATAIQELAFTLAHGITYVQYATEQAGLNVDSFAPRISFFFNAHNNFFEEIAKFRAARRIWASVMKERFRAQSPKSWMLRFHTQTAGCTLTAQEPQNNAIRVAFQALSAVLGGTQSLHTNSRDEALGLPTEESVKLALRTQQIIGFESGVAQTIDPLGGSYFVERLTTDIEKAVRTYLQKVDDMGGALKAIESGYFQKEIHQSAYEYQQAIERGDTSVVGVNKFTDRHENRRFSILKVAPHIVAKQIKRLQKIKYRRNNEKVEYCLGELERGAMEGSSIMPLIIDCVRVYATVGEISDTLRSVYGIYEEKSIF
jgi:methylmalonyl-CoA mutase N-terminal domain/subunit